MKVSVLRLNHRVNRDKRVTTHVFLAARALGADEGLLSGDEDTLLVNNVNKTCEKWGGSFRVRYCRNWRKLLKQTKSKIIHLSMFGMPVQDKISKIRKHDSLLVVVGSSKVPPDVYDLSDYNISVTCQPHSEISSLTVFLHELFRGKELDKKFTKSKIKIIPQEKGKKIV